MARLNLRTLLLVAGVVLAALGGSYLLFVASQNSVYDFPNAIGPKGRSVVPAFGKATIADFDRGSNHRLAVLVTDPASGWLGLARGLKAHGIPFTLTTDVARALEHKVVFVYPTISGRTLKSHDFRALEQHVRGGGYLLAFDVEGGGLQQLFGIAGAPRPDHADILRWTTGSSVPEEAETRISRTGSEAAVGALAYSPTSGEVGARFEDGAAGLVCGRSPGLACALGVDLGALSERAMDGRGEEIARMYVNGYEPSLDTLYAWLSAFYVKGEPMPWLIDTAPAGHQFSIILSHDIDYTKAVAYAKHFADVFKELGVKATFFMQTKYVRDFNDDVFFRKKTLPDVRGLLEDGMEVGSHSVAHARTFKAFDFGSGREAYPNYQPFVQSKTAARGGSVLGELRVSKFLLDRLANADVVSFSAGHLSYPFRLPDALAATGYLNDSSITANSSLTDLPFQLTYGRTDGALAPVYELPVTIEDEAPPSLPTRLDAANLVLSKIAARHGLAVILVHPDAGAKLGFERAVVSRWRGQAWFASMREFGDWWRARDALEIDVVPRGSGWRMSVPPGTYRNVRVELPKAGAIPQANGPRFSATKGAVTVSGGSQPASLDFQ